MTNIFDELRAALFSVWHRRWLALAVAWGLCLLGWLAVAMVPNSYESKARIFVQRCGTDNDLRLGGPFGHQMTAASGTEMPQLPRR